MSEPDRSADAETLRRSVHDWFREHAGTFGLDRARLDVAYVLNWGGFVNFSYRITDGRRAYHLKLAVTPENAADLARWRELATLLERYHAPRVVDWIDIGPAAGLLFDHVPGEVPALGEEVVAEIVPVLTRLHQDAELADALPWGQSRTAADDYFDNFDRRFTEDLAGVRATPPPFVSESRIAWLEAEAARLREAVAAMAAFAQPLTEPIHGDLWLNNVLWQSQGEWHILDWDHVRIGDPALDFASLLGPSMDDLRPLKLREHADAVLTRTQQERLTLLGRATLLDWCIDPLSDWIDASLSPEHAPHVRAEKQRIHTQALELYRTLYP